MPTGSKKNQHILPELYLRGFCEEDSSHIWVYKREGEYNPGRGINTSNPCYLSVRRAGAEYAAYAVREGEEIVDLDTYENALERLEKPHDAILKKLQRLEALTEEERMLFVRYVILMLKRIPARIEKVQRVWPQIVEEGVFGTAIPFILQRVREESMRFGPEFGRELGSTLWEEAQRTYDSYRPKIPDRIRLNSMLLDLPQVQTLLEQTPSVLLRAPAGEFFVTSDNPVWTTSGFIRPDSELIFPVTSQLCLAISPRVVEGQGIVTVDPHTVAEVNKRIIHQATKHVFACQASENLHRVVLASGGYSGN